MACRGFTGHPALDSLVDHQYTGFTCGPLLGSTQDVMHSTVMPSSRPSELVEPAISDGGGPTDRYLMERIRDGDRDSFGTLLARHWQPLVTYAAGLLDGLDDAEDVVQETFVRVWRYRATWEATGAVAGYLYRITRNLALNALRKRGARRSREAHGGIELTLPGSPRSPVLEAESESLRREIDAALRCLSERRREAFILSRFHGLTHGEIAEAMGISVPTVANQITTALAQLRKALAHHLNDE
jgi:RNA polymerase sigma-70 factor, ECF subfamily